MRRLEVKTLVEQEILPTPFRVDAPEDLVKEVLIRNEAVSPCRLPGVEWNAWKPVVGRQDGFLFSCFGLAWMRRDNPAGVGSFLHASLCDPDPRLSAGLRVNGGCTHAKPNGALPHQIGHVGLWRQTPPI